MHVPQVNEVWSGDITYVRTSGGFIYMAAIIDWHSRAILSYKLSNSMDATLVTDVLKEALRKYGTPRIFNSDQGSQYTSYEHTQLSFFVLIFQSSIRLSHLDKSLSKIT